MRLRCWGCRFLLWTALACAAGLDEALLLALRSSPQVVVARFTGADAVSSDLHYFTSIEVLRGRPG